MNRRNEMIKTFGPFKFEKFKLSGEYEYEFPDPDTNVGESICIVAVYIDGDKSRNAIELIAQDVIEWLEEQILVEGVEA